MRTRQGIKRQYLFYVTLSDSLGMASYGPRPTQREIMEDAKAAAKATKFDVQNGEAILQAIDLKTLAMTPSKIKPEDLSDAGNEEKG